MVRRPQVLDRWEAQGAEKPVPEEKESGGGGGPVEGSSEQHSEDRLM